VEEVYLTELLDRRISSGSTLYRPSPTPPALQAARDFYERGVPLIDQRKIEILATDETMEWLGQWMESRLNDLLRLPDRWDGARAHRVTLEAASAATFAAFAVARDSKLSPQVFPLIDGGLQLEWHAAGLALEIEIDASGEGHVLAIDDNGAELINDEFSADPPLNVDKANNVLSQIAARVAGVR
jgi:hypothetical protein